MKNTILRLTLLFFFVCTPIIANQNKGSSLFKGQPASSPFIISLSGGAGFTDDTGDSQTFPIVNPITDEAYHYAPTNDNQSAGLFNLSLGKEWRLTPTFAVQAALSYYYLGQLNADGSLTQGADAQSSDHFNYDYKIYSQQVLVESKWLYVYQSIRPYFLIGLGTAINTAKDYTVSMPPFITFTRIYDDNTTTAFSYNAGVGIDYDMTPFVRLGIGYRFTDLGNVSLGDANIDTSRVSGRLSQSHLYVNEVVAQLIFVI